MKALASIAAGAVLGAWARWALALALNRTHRWLPFSADLPYGTLAANLLGGLAVGAAMAFFASREIDPAWRLFVVTGFLGALTTFSTFSAESLALVQRDAFGTALLHAAAHLLGSFAAAWIGWRLARMGA